MNASNSRLTRRDFAARLFAGAALAALPTVEYAAPAMAGRTWCKTDPGLRVGGKETHVNLYSYQEMFDAATGPVLLIVTVPVGDEGKTELLYMDEGFRHGYDLVVKESIDLKDSSTGIDILVEAYAPATDGELPVKVEVVPVDRGKKPKFRKGQANQWIPVRGKI
jgi:hypothetical protein